MTKRKGKFYLPGTCSYVEWIKKASQIMGLKLGFKEWKREILYLAREEKKSLAGRDEFKKIKIIMLFMTAKTKGYWICFQFSFHCPKGFLHLSLCGRTFQHTTLGAVESYNNRD